MCSKTNIQGKKTNSLRASGITHMFQAGLPEKVIQDRCGHRSLDGLRKYECISEEQQAEACKALALHAPIDQETCKALAPYAPTDQDPIAVNLSVFSYVSPLPAAAADTYLLACLVVLCCRTAPLMFHGPQVKQQKSDD